LAVDNSADVRSKNKTGDANAFEIEYTGRRGIGPLEAKAQQREIICFELAAIIKLRSLN
jgi:hypothetical protein